MSEGKNNLLNRGQPQIAQQFRNRERNAQIRCQRR